MLNCIIKSCVSSSLIICLLKRSQSENRQMSNMIASLQEWTALVSLLMEMHMSIYYSFDAHLDLMSIDLYSVSCLKCQLLWYLAPLPLISLMFKWMFIGLKWFLRGVNSSIKQWIFHDLSPSLQNILYAPPGVVSIL